MGFFVDWGLQYQLFFVFGFVIIFVIILGCCRRFFLNRKHGQYRNLDVEGGLSSTTSHNDTTQPDGHHVAAPCIVNVDLRRNPTAPIPTIELNGQPVPHVPLTQDRPRVPPRFGTNALRAGQHTPAVKFFDSVYGPEGDAPRKVVEKELPLLKRLVKFFKKSTPAEKQEDAARKVRLVVQKAEQKLKATEEKDKAAAEKLKNKTEEKEAEHRMATANLLAMSGAMLTAPGLTCAPVHRVDTSKHPGGLASHPPPMDYHSSFSKPPSFYEIDKTKVSAAQVRMSKEPQTSVPLRRTPAQRERPYSTHDVLESVKEEQKEEAKKAAAKTASIATRASESSGSSKPSTGYNSSIKTVQSDSRPTTADPGSPQDRVADMIKLVDSRRASQVAGMSGNLQEKQGPIVANPPPRHPPAPRNKIIPRNQPAPFLRTHLPSYQQPRPLSDAAIRYELVESDSNSFLMSGVGNVIPETDESYRSIFNVDPTARALPEFPQRPSLPALAARPASYHPSSSSGGYRSINANFSARRGSRGSMFGEEFDDIPLDDLRPRRLSWVGLLTRH